MVPVWRSAFKMRPPERLALDAGYLGIAASLALELVFQREIQGKPRTTTVQEQTDRAWYIVESNCTKSHQFLDPKSIVMQLGQ
jgi:hypothetical protein